MFAQSTPLLDFISLIEALAWPVVILVLGLVFGDKLVALLERFFPGLRSFSIGPFKIELATAKALPMAFEGKVDLRHAGRSADVNDSTLRSFYDQIRDPTPVDYVVVDLGQGREWLCSRLYILSVIMSRMRGLKAVAFVETAGHVRRHFVGLADCAAIRWRLAMAYPWLEAAYVEAEQKHWGSPGSTNFPVKIVDVNGRCEGQFQPLDTGADLLRDFLDAIQRPALMNDDPDWVPLMSPQTPQTGQPTHEERAGWLNAADIERIMGPSLSHAALSKDGIQAKPAADQVRQIVAQKGHWVALLRNESVFDYLLDRSRIVEETAQQVLGA